MNSDNSPYRPPNLAKPVTLDLYPASGNTKWCLSIFSRHITMIQRQGFNEKSRLQ
jgi:hypothetical protein